MSEQPVAATQSRLADDVARYLSFGEHRAGMPSEAPTADWFAQCLRQAGYQTELQRFPIRTILNPGGQISTASATAEVFPQWLPPVTALGATFDARLLPLAADTGGPSIRLVMKPTPVSGNWSATQDALVAAAAATGALALVMAQDDPTGDLYVSNQHSLEPLPIPVLLVARRSLAALAEAADQGQSAHLSIVGRQVDTSAINVVGRKPGRGKSVVISTPLTGWFHCGGERGPGIAVLLRAARHLATLNNPVVAIGTGSHEIGHLGMDRLLKQGQLRPADVAFWFHFGASLGATKLDAQYGVTTSHLVVGTAITEALLRPAFATLVKRYANGNARTAGESGQVLGAGFARFAGMVGTFPTFHTPADRGEAIDYALLEKIADASLDVIRRGAAD